ncbi:MAG: hypothetical protein GY832_26525 [Chloroflexi bacterium]|nr:hypothetical protein [Chloroflexota bacterium]
MTSWDTLLNHLERRWNASHKEVCEQLIVTIRYAVFTQLDFVQSASDLLKKGAESSQVQNWAEKCYDICQDWLNDYWKLQERCLSNSDNQETVCKCILQGIGPLLANSVGLLKGELILSLDGGNLIGEDMNRIVKQLLQKLTVVVQIHNEISSQDLSWLLTYIDNEDKLGQRHS